MIDFDKMLKEENKQQENKMIEQTTKRYPNYNGKVQLETGIGEREDVGKIALWNNEEPTNENSPLQTGTITIQIPEINATRTYRVAIWKNKPKQDNHAN